MEARLPSSANLGPRLESYVTELVNSGRYNSRSEVLRESIRLVEEREKRLTLLDAAIGRALQTPRRRIRTVSDVEKDLLASMTSGERTRILIVVVNRRG